MQERLTTRQRDSLAGSVDQWLVGKLDDVPRLAAAARPVGEPCTPSPSSTGWLARPASDDCGRRMTQRSARTAPLAERSGFDVHFDLPGHVRLPIMDDEIVDRALAVQILSGKDVTFLTYATGQAMRARKAGLARVNKLVQDSGRAGSGS